jgi:hypothetical protein
MILFKLPVAAMAAALFAAAAGLVAWQSAPDTFLPVPRVKHSPVDILRNPDATPARGSRNQMMTSNWSGYVSAQYMSGNPQPFTSAQMTWVVPRARYGRSNDSVFSDEFSANWVGIGGSCTDAQCTGTDPTLIQLGTEQDVSPFGRTHYFAWYEMLPQFPKAIGLAINPGDRVTATLSCGNTCSQRQQTWTLTMQDGVHSWVKRVSYHSSQLSAEWIEEAPTERSVLPLADIGHAYFAAGRGANGETPALTVAENGLQMADPWGQTADPSSATSFGQFVTCWGFAAFTDCPTP